MATTQGTDILASSPEELARVVKTEVKLWSKVARSIKSEQ
jgi:hypothetical protein